MPRTGIPTDRIGARVRIGRVNEGIDQTPYIFQQEGLIQRVGTPEELKRGVIGYTARGVLTFDGLKKASVDQFNSKIKDLETKKKQASSTMAQIYKEGQDTLNKYAKQTRDAKKLQDIIPFTRVNEAVGEYVNFKSGIIGSYEDRITRIQDQIQRNERYIDRLYDRMRGESGEARINWNYNIREERVYTDGLKRELAIIKDFKNKNLNEIKFGEELMYYPFEQVSRYADQVANVFISNRIARLWNARQRAIANERAKQELNKLLKQYPGAKAAPDGSLYYVDPNLRQSIILLPPGSVKTK